MSLGSADAHGASWHDGASCREEPQKTGCEAEGVSQHVAPRSSSTKAPPNPPTEPIVTTWLHHLQISRNDCKNVSRYSCGEKKDRRTSSKANYFWAMGTNKQPELFKKRKDIFEHRHHKSAAAKNRWDHSRVLWYCNTATPSCNTTLCTWYLMKNKHPVKDIPLGPGCLHLCLFVMKGSFWCESERDRLGWLVMS